MITIKGRVAAQMIAKMKTYRKKTTTQCVQMDRPFRLFQDTNEVSGELIANAGDWLCLSATGGLYPIPDNRFHDLYEEESNGDGGHG